MTLSNTRPLLLTLVAAGCSTPSLQPDVAALRTSQDEASKTELEQVLSTAMNGVDVTIADDALTTSSRLILERGSRRQIDRPPEPGRSYDRPDHFQLVLDGRRCFLVHEETGLRYLLRDTDCEAE